MTKAQVKQNFIDFMKSKYEPIGMWIPSTQALVQQRADELDYVFEGRTFGGKRKMKRNKTLKKKNIKKKNKTLHKMKTKNTTRNKKSKKYTKRRKLG